MTDTQKQIRIFVRKQKREIWKESRKEQRDYLIMMWQGYLTGLHLTNAIDQEEYMELLDEIKKFAADIGAA